MATDFIAPALSKYIDAAVAHLDPVPNRIIRYQPGEEVAWDECGCDDGAGGQLWARVVQITAPSYRVKADGTVCDIPYWNVTIGLGIIRCVGVVNDAGEPPSAERISSDGAQMLRDIATLQEVVLCVGLTTGIIEWRPLGPQGGCAGGEWVIQTRVATCACPDPY